LTERRDVSRQLNAENPAELLLALNEEGLVVINSRTHRRLTPDKPWTRAASSGEEGPSAHLGGVPESSGGELIGGIDGRIAHFKRCQ